MAKGHAQLASSPKRNANHLYPISNSRMCVDNGQTLTFLPIKSGLIQIGKVCVLGYGGLSVNYLGM